IGTAAMLLLSGLFSLLAIAARSIGMINTALVFMLIGIILWCLLQIPAVIGYVFCLFAPNKNGTMALSITTLAIAGVVLILKLLVLIPLLGAGVRGLGGFGPFGGGGGGGLEDGGGGGMGGMPFMSASTGIAAVIIIAILELLLFYSEYVIFALYLRAVALNVK